MTGPAKKNVDDIWAALKRGAAPKPQQHPQGTEASGPKHSSSSSSSSAAAAAALASTTAATKHQDFEKLWSSFSGGVSISNKAAPREAAAYQQGYKPPAAAAAASSSSAAAGGGGGGAITAASKAGPPPPDTFEALEAALQRDLQGLQDTSPWARKRAVLNIRDALLSEPQPPEDVVTEVAEEIVVKQLLRRYDDSSEGTREAAIALVKDIVQRYPDSTLAVLPYVMPVLQERMAMVEGSKDPTEPAEELRLQMMQTLRLLIDNADKAMIAYASEVAMVTKGGCADSFHEVLEETCVCMQGIVGILGMRLGKQGHPLVADVCPLLAHNRFRVRVAAVKTLRTIIPTGSHEMILQLVAHRDPNQVAIKSFYGDSDIKVNFCARLATDRHPAVRAEFLEAMGDWLLHLPERNDHDQRLLPYVLSFHGDEVESISARAVEIMDSIGAQHEKDRMHDDGRYTEAKYYLPEEAHALGWKQDNGQIPIYGDEEEDVLEGQREGRRRVRMPPPFKQRPALGARLLAQANFNRTVGTMCEEISSWITEHRPRIARLLMTNLVYQEDHITAELFRVLPAFQRVICEDRELRPDVERCCEMIGCFAEPQQYLDILMPFLEGEALLDQTKTAPTLAVLAAVVSGAGPQLAQNGHLRRVLGALEADVVGMSNDTAVRAEAMNLAEAVLTACGASVADEEEEAVTAVFLRLLGSAAIHQQAGDAAPSGQAAATGMLERLAGLAGLPGHGALVAAHRSALLDRMRPRPGGAYSAQQVASFCLLLGADEGSLADPGRSASRPPPAPLQLKPQEGGGAWTQEDTQKVLECLIDSTRTATSQSQLRLVSAMGGFVRTADASAITKDQACSIISAMQQMAKQGSHSDQEQHELASATLAAARCMLAREIGGRDGVSSWLGPVLEMAADSSSMDAPSELRLGAVLTLHEVLASPVALKWLGALGSLPFSAAIQEAKDSNRPEEGATGGPTSDAAVTAMLRQQPAWLAALAQRLDDSGAPVRTAAAEALSALLMAAAAAAPSGITDDEDAEGTSSLSASSRSRTAVLLVSLMLRQQNDVASEMRDAVQEFTEVAEKLFPDELFSCLGLVDTGAGDS